MFGSKDTPIVFLFLSRKGPDRKALRSTLGATRGSVIISLAEVSRLFTLPAHAPDSSVARLFVFRAFLWGPPGPVALPWNAISGGSFSLLTASGGKSFP